MNRTLFCQILIPTILMLSISITNAQTAKLTDYKWKHRIVIVEGAEQGAKYQNQSALLKDAEDECKERLLVIIADQEVHTGKHITKALSKHSYLLIGLDGGIKLRSKSPFSATELWKVIDSMPMRRSEIDGDQ